jgi:hypothetical protein
VTGYASFEGSRINNSNLVRARAVAVGTFVREILHQEHISDVSLTLQDGGIRHLASQLQDQVAILSA